MGAANMKCVKRIRLAPKLGKIREKLQSRIDSGRMSGMLPGVHQLAREFGVNFQTVSKALDQLECDEILYRIPNMGTFIKQKNRIGLLAPNMPRALMETPVYAKVLLGIEEELSLLRKTLVLWQSIPSDEQILNDVDGMIVFLYGTKKLQVKTALDKIPCVRIMGLVDNSENWDHITYDNQAIGVAAAEYLFSKGHRNCAYIGPNGENPIFAGRADSFQEKINASGGSVWRITDDHLAIVSEDLNMVDRHRMLEIARMIARRSPRPTGLFVPADMFACVLYGALSEAGIRPGIDIQIVSCNNENSFLMGLHPQPAVIDIHSEEIGRRAVNRIIWRMKHRKNPCEKILLKPHMIPAEA